MLFVVVCCRVCDVCCLLCVDCKLTYVVSFFVACRMLFGVSFLMFVACCWWLVASCSFCVVCRGSLFVFCCLMCVVCRLLFCGCVLFVAG